MPRQPHREPAVSLRPALSKVTRSRFAAACSPEKLSLQTPDRVLLSWPSARPASATGVIQTSPRRSRRSSRGRRSRSWRSARPAPAIGVIQTSPFRSCALSSRFPKAFVRKVLGFRAMPDARRAGRDARRTKRAGARRRRRAVEAAQQRYRGGKLGARENCLRQRRVSGRTSVRAGSRRTLASRGRTRATGRIAGPRAARPGGS